MRMGGQIPLRMAGQIHAYLQYVVLVKQFTGIPNRTLGYFPIFLSMLLLAPHIAGRLAGGKL